MNLNSRVVWSRQVLRELPDLSAWEQAKLGWLADYADLIKELSLVLTVSESLISKLKVGG